MENEKTKISVTKPVKREIDLLAASEQRPVYLVVEDMVEAYKATRISKLPRPNKKAKPIPVIEVIAAQ